MNKITEIIVETCGGQDKYFLEGDLDFLKEGDCFSIVIVEGAVEIKVEVRYKKTILYSNKDNKKQLTKCKTIVTAYEVADIL